MSPPLGTRLRAEETRSKTQTEIFAVIGMGPDQVLKSAFT
jgi:hypothetical protein